VATASPFLTLVSDSITWTRTAVSSGSSVSGASAMFPALMTAQSPTLDQKMEINTMVMPLLHPMGGMLNEKS
jgi:hypothetical protein